LRNRVTDCGVDPSGVSILSEVGVLAVQNLEQNQVLERS